MRNYDIDIFSICQECHGAITGADGSWLTEEELTDKAKKLILRQNQWWDSSNTFTATFDNCVYNLMTATVKEIIRELERRLKANLHGVYPELYSWETHVRNV